MSKTTPRNKALNRQKSIKYLSSGMIQVFNNGTEA